MASAPSTRTKVFISYSHADKPWLERLKRHLKPAVREGRLDYWDDTHIRPGDDWKQEIRTALDVAQVAVLLISADFFASDFIDENELPPLLTAAQAKGVRILPVILSACRFARSTSLARFQAVNPPDRPLAEMPQAEQEKVLDRLAHAIERTITAHESEAAGSEKEISAKGAGESPVLQTRMELNETEGRGRALARTKREKLGGKACPAGGASPTDVSPPALLERPSRCWGRDKELQELVAALTSDTPSAIALVLGGPGLGKTTLTLEVASSDEVVRRYGSRRWLARLERSMDVWTLETAIISGLGLETATTRFETALAWLKEAPGLVVLDNLDTPWEGDSTAVEVRLGQLAAVPGVAVVASFRGLEAPLGVRCRPQIRLEALSAAEAKRLFLDVAPGIPASDPHLAQLLEELGGVPLAIELVAHQASVFGSLGDLWREWQRLGIALARRRGLEPGRLTSLEKSLELSLESRRLGKAGRRLFGMLGQLSAELAPEDRDILLGAQSFEAASDLLAVGLAVQCSDRLDLLPPVRNYARRFCRPDHEDADRWRRHYLELAADWSQRDSTRGIDTRDIVARLVPEMPNIEAAVRASIEAGALNQTMYVLLMYHRFGGEIGSAAPAVLREMADAFRRDGNSADQADCLILHGTIALRRLNLEAARKDFGTALPITRLHGKTHDEAMCHSGLGFIAWERKDYESAREAYEAALRLYNTRENTLNVADCALKLAQLALNRSDRDSVRAMLRAAQKAYEAKLKETDQFDKKFFEPMILGVKARCFFGLGDVARLQQNSGPAKSHYKKALKLYESLAYDKYQIGFLYERLSLVTEGDERDRHVSSAREAWKSAGLLGVLARYAEISLAVRASWATPT